MLKFPKFFLKKRNSVIENGASALQQVTGDATMSKSLGNIDNNNNNNNNDFENNKGNQSIAKKSMSIFSEDSLEATQTPSTPDSSASSITVVSKIITSIFKVDVMIIFIFSQPCL